MRAAVLVLSTLLCLLLAGSAFAQESSPLPPTPPPPPTEVGPDTVQPPPPPVLPDKDKKGKKGNKGQKGGKGGKQDGGKKGGKKGKGGKGNDLKPSCGAFEYTQTYTNWGPALSYGRPVTVAYSATRCSKPRGRALDLSVRGTATIREVAALGAVLIESKPFSVTGTWARPGNDSGWPPAWWQCGVRYAEYTWQIPGTYTFHVSARDGAWALDVHTQGPAPKTITWSYNAC